MAAVDADADRQVDPDECAGVVLHGFEWHEAGLSVFQQPAVDWLGQEQRR